MKSSWLDVGNPLVDYKYDPAGCQSTGVVCTLYCLPACRSLNPPSPPPSFVYFVADFA